MWKKNNKKFKTDLITSFILLLAKALFVNHIARVKKKWLLLFFLRKNLLDIWEKWKMP